MIKIVVSTDKGEVEDLKEILNDTELLELQTGNLTLVSGQYRDAYDQVEILEKRLKELKRKKEVIAARLYDLLVEANLTSIKTEEGSFGPELKSRASYDSTYAEHVFDFLEERGLGDIVKRTVPWQTFNKVFNEGKLDGWKEEIPHAIKTWEVKTIRLRRSGPKPGDE